MPSISGSASIRSAHFDALPPGRQGDEETPSWITMPFSPTPPTLLSVLYLGALYLAASMARSGPDSADGHGDLDVQQSHAVRVCLLSLSLRRQTHAHILCRDGHCHLLSLAEDLWLPSTSAHSFAPHEHEDSDEYAHAHATSSSPAASQPLALGFPATTRTRSRAQPRVLAHSDCHSPTHAHDIARV